MAKDNIMKSILIVEDDITFGMMLKTWLGKKGFEVDSASNIARAKRCIEAQMPDLILSDLRLPDQDGIHLLKWMNEQHMDIPLIIMTGYADIQSAVQAIKLGARDYMFQSSTLFLSDFPYLHFSFDLVYKKLQLHKPILLIVSINSFS